MGIVEQIIMTVITTGIGYFVGYKKNEAEVETTKLDNLEKSIRVYNVIIEDLSEKVQELTAHVSRLEETIERLMKENKSLKQKTKV